MTIPSTLCPSSPISCCADVPNPVLLCRSLGSGDTAEGCPPSPSTWDAPHRSNTSGLRAGRRFEPILSMSVLKTKPCVCTSADLAMERSNLFQAIASNTLLMGSLWQQGQLSADNPRVHSFAEWMPSRVNTSTVYLEKMKIRWNSWGFWQVERFSPQGTGTVSLNLYSWNTTKVLN